MQTETESETCPYGTRYASRHALAELPWFDLHKGELVLADKSVGPIIDVHTHYALPTLAHTQVDLTRETPDSNLLLGVCCAHHLDVYANRCFSPSELRSLKRELLVGALTGKGKRLDHTAPNLARDMRSMGVVRSVVIGVDIGLPSFHPKQTLETARGRDDVVGYGSVHPRSRRAREKFEEQVHLGARGIKVHPPNMFTRPDDPRAMTIYRWCGEENMPVFWHCGPAGIEPKAGQEVAQVRYYEPALREFPGTTFVLGHTGAMQHREAIALHKRYRNAWVDSSCLSLGQLRELVAEGDTDRMLFGSDWPFYHPVLPLAKVLIALEGRPDVRRKILHDNAARLLEQTARAR